MRLIDAEVLKEEVSKGSILIEDDVLECETDHKIMVYVLAKLEDFVLKKIDEQPTVEAKEVVHGKWIKRVKNNGGYVASITCSACGYSHSRVTYNFCPECGADMRGEKNGL